MPDSTTNSEAFKNPITFENITDFFEAILTLVITVALPIILFMIIYGGFMYVTAKGSPEKIQTAHKSLLYGVIGGVIILAAFAILEIVKNLVAEF